MNAGGPTRERAMNQFAALKDPPEGVCGLAGGSGHGRHRRSLGRGWPGDCPRAISGGFSGWEGALLPAESGGSAGPLRHDGAMANGKPGDHPLTDILNWDREVYGSEPDDLIRQIVRLGGEKYLESGATNLLMVEPTLASRESIVALTENLRQLRDRLRADAIERGWEVD
jgi:hypothetical protein